MNYYSSNVDFCFVEVIIIHVTKKGGEKDNTCNSGECVFGLIINLLDPNND